MINLKNTSQEPKSVLPGVTATLTTGDPYIQLINSQAYFGDIARFEVKNNSQQPYSLKVSKDIPPEHKAKFDLKIHNNLGKLTLKLELLLARTIRVPGDYNSIEDAINAASPGETIYVMPGKYEAPANVSVQLKPGMQLIGSGPDKTSYYQTKSASKEPPSFFERGFVRGADYAAIEGITISGDYFVLDVYHSRKMRVSNTRIIGNYAPLRLFYGEKSRFEGSEIIPEGAYSDQAIMVIGSDNTFSKNRIYGVTTLDNSHQNIFDYNLMWRRPKERLEYLNPVLLNIYNNSKSNQFIFNTFYGPFDPLSKDPRYQQGALITIAAYSSETIFSNNIIASGTPEVIRLYADKSSELTIRYTLLDKELLSGSVKKGEAIIVGDPMFVDPGAGNFNLKKVSPAIDGGDPKSPLDPDGTRADLGAFSYTQFYRIYLPVIFNGYGSGIVTPTVTVTPRAVGFEPADRLAGAWRLDEP